MAKAPARKPRAKVDPDETPADRFKRLAEGRVSNALLAIQQIGNLTGSSYEYTPDQLQKILDALGNAFDQLEEKFKSPDKPKLFSL